MYLNIITPNDFEKMDKKYIKNYIKDINKSMLYNHRRYKYEYAKLSGVVLPIHIIEKLCEIYRKNGWKYIYYKIYDKSVFPHENYINFIFVMDDSLVSDAEKLIYIKYISKD